MSRITIEPNIAWDDERNVYYVTLNYGKGADGKNKKSQQNKEDNDLYCIHKY